MARGNQKRLKEGRRPRTFLNKNEKQDRNSKYLDEVSAEVDNYIQSNSKGYYNQFSGFMSNMFYGAKTTLLSTGSKIAGIFKRTNIKKVNKQDIKKVFENQDIIKDELTRLSRQCLENLINKNWEDSDKDALQKSLDEELEKLDKEVEQIKKTNGVSITSSDLEYYDRLKDYISKISIRYDSELYDVEELLNGIQYIHDEQYLGKEFNFVRNHSIIMSFLKKHKLPIAWSRQKTEILLNLNDAYDTYRHSKSLDNTVFYKELLDNIWSDFFDNKAFEKLFDDVTFGKGVDRIILLKSDLLDKFGNLNNVLNIIDSIETKLVKINNSSNVSSDDMLTSDETRVLYKIGRYKRSLSWLLKMQNLDETNYYAQKIKSINKVFKKTAMLQNALSAGDIFCSSETSSLGGQFALGHAGMLTQDREHTIKHSHVLGNGLVHDDDVNFYELISNDYYKMKVDALVNENIWKKLQGRSICNNKDDFIQKIFKAYQSQNRKILKHFNKAKNISYRSHGILNNIIPQFMLDKMPIADSYIDIAMSAYLQQNLPTIFERLKKHTSLIKKYDYKTFIQKISSGDVQDKQLFEFVCTDFVAFTVSATIEKVNQHFKNKYNISEDVLKQPIEEVTYQTPYSLMQLLYDKKFITPNIELIKNLSRYLSDDAIIKNSSKHFQELCKEHYGKPLEQLLSEHRENVRETQHVAGVDVSAQPSGKSGDAKNMLNGIEVEPEVVEDAVIASNNVNQTSKKIKTSSNVLAKANSNSSGESLSGVTRTQDKKEKEGSYIISESISNNIPSDNLGVNFNEMSVDQLLLDLVRYAHDVKHDDLVETIKNILTKSQSRWNQNREEFQSFLKGVIAIEDIKLKDLDIKFIMKDQTILNLRMDSQEKDKLIKGVTLQDISDNTDKDSINVWTSLSMLFTKLNDEHLVNCLSMTQEGICFNMRDQNVEQLFRDIISDLSKENEKMINGIEVEPEVVEDNVEDVDTDTSCSKTFMESVDSILNLFYSNPVSKTNSAKNQTKILNKEKVMQQVKSSAAVQNKKFIDKVISRGAKKKTPTNAMQMKKDMQKLRRSERLLNQKTR